MIAEIQYKNATISYSTEGKGTAVVFLHGFLENKNMWDFMRKSRLASKRFICIDLLGHGKSDCLGYVHSMEDFADAVFAVLKHLRIRRFVLIGHSLGGYVALALAEKHPEKIKGICLLNSTAKADDKAKKLVRTRAVKMAQTNYESLVRISFLNLFSETSKKNCAYQINLAVEAALKTSLQGYIAANEGMKIREDKRVFLKVAVFKKCYIIGKKDPVLESNSILEEAENTASDSVVLSQGHMSHIENREELTKHVLHFIKNCE